MIVEKNGNLCFYRDSKLLNAPIVREATLFLLHTRFRLVGMKKRYGGSVT